MTREFRTTVYAFTSIGILNSPPRATKDSAAPTSRASTKPPRSRRRTIA